MQSGAILITMARMGFAARGLLYVAIGYLALRLGKATDQSEALAWIGGTGGKLVLAIMAIGFLGYGAWRLLDAGFDGEGAGTGAKAIAKRLGGGVSGLIHLGFAFVATTLVFDMPHGGRNGAEQGASMALSFPGGAIALMLFAGMLVVVGAYQLINAMKLGFLKHIDAAIASKPWIAWLGRIGYLARGTVFVLVAMFTWRAGDQHRSAAAGGTAEAIDYLPDWLRIVVATGFVMFGIFSVVEAQFRRLNDPDVEGRVRRAVG
jgi:hypothetical protein